MPIRDYQSLMLPTLNALADGTEAPLGKIRERIAVSEKLTVEEVSQVLPSGRQTVLANRVSWVLLGMERAGLVGPLRNRRGRHTAPGRRHRQCYGTLTPTESLQRTGLTHVTRRSSSGLTGGCRRWNTHFAGRTAVSCIHGQTPRSIDGPVLAPMGGHGPRHTRCGLADGVAHASGRDGWPTVVRQGRRRADTR